jgi:hypothetical protein
MIPEVPVEESDRSMSGAPPLSALLILPVPKTEPKKKNSIWISFMNDLMLLLPIFGALLGYMLLAGQAPFIGAMLVTVCPIILLVRLHGVYLMRQERRQVAALERWYRAYRAEYENIWKTQ